MLSAVAFAAAATGPAPAASQPAPGAPSASVDVSATSLPLPPLPPVSEAPVSTPVPTPEPSSSAVAAPPAFTLSSIPADLRVQVPRLDIDLPLVVGDLTRDTPGPAYKGGTPERVALIYPTSAPPGAGGNTYVYAHARRGMFLALWGVGLGDTVRIRSDGTSLLLTYTVTSILRSVPPTDTTWLAQGGPERVTLQTSTGPLPMDPRFVVIAMRDR